MGCCHAVQEQTASHCCLNKICSAAESIQKLLQHCTGLSKAAKLSNLSGSYHFVHAHEWPVYNMRCKELQKINVGCDGHVGSRTSAVGFQWSVMGGGGMLQQPCGGS